MLHADSSMDTVTQYEKIREQRISKYAQFRPSHGNIRLDPVFDEKHRRYGLMQTGWDRERRVRGNLMHDSVVIDTNVLISMLVAKLDRLRRHFFLETVELFKHKERLCV